MNDLVTEFLKKHPNTDHVHLYNVLFSFSTPNLTNMDLLRFAKLNFGQQCYGYTHMHTNAMGTPHMVCISGVPISFSLDKMSTRNLNSWNGELILSSNGRGPSHPVLHFSCPYRAHIEHQNLTLCNSRRVLQS